MESDELENNFDMKDDRLPLYPIMGNRLDSTLLLMEMLVRNRISFEPVSTCYCGSKEFKRLTVFDRFGYPFGTIICKRCGLITCDPVLTKDSVPTFYEKIYWGLINARTTKSRRKFTTQTSESREIVNFIGESIPNKNKLVVKEIGCGGGQKLVALKSILNSTGYEIEIIGCDLSKDAVKEAKRNGVDARVGHVEVLDDGKGCDLLIMSHVLEHFVDIDEVLSDVNRLLDDSSLIYVEVPGVLDLLNKSEYDYCYRQYTVLAHIHNFSLKSLRMVMEKNGYGFLKGNEYIRSLFTLKRNIDNVDVSNNYEEIVEYLGVCEKKSYFYKRKIGQVIKRIIRPYIYLLKR